MAYAIICDPCTTADKTVVASEIKIDITETTPDDEVRHTAKTVHWCPECRRPVTALVELLTGEEASEPPAPSVPAPERSSAAPAPPDPRPSDELLFECLICNEGISLSKRGTHARSRHTRAVDEVTWLPKFDVEASGLAKCSCGYLHTSGYMTRHLNATGHTEDVGKAALKSEDFTTETGKALLEAANA